MERTDLDLALKRLACGASPFHSVELLSVVETSYQKKNCTWHLHRVRPNLVTNQAFKESGEGIRQIGNMFYGVMVWDPWLILSQILCIQCLNYLSLGFLLWLLVGTHAPRFTLSYFFDYSMFTTSTFTGWCVIAAFLLNALAGAGFLLVVVERAKKCLDFAATMHIIHLFFCLIYGGLPSSLIWWLVNGTSILVATVLGEWLCIRRELREIPIRSTRASV